MCDMNTFWFEFQVCREVGRVPSVGSRSEARARRDQNIYYLALLTNSISISQFPEVHLMDDGNSITTRLLTLLNVSATKIGKRKRIEEDFIPSEKLNKRKSTEPNAEEKENDSAKEEDTVPATNGEDVEMKDEEQDADQNGSFQLQFLK